MAVVKTYLGAVKPVGEKIILNYVNTAAQTNGVTVADSYDFLLDANYCVTGVEITKTGTTNIGAGNLLTARVDRINQSGTPTEIGQAALAVGTLAVGSKNVAGIPSSTVSVAAGLATATNTYLDPTVLVQANVNGATATGTNNARQLIRLTITIVPAIAASFQSSCLVEIQLCKYGTITQGVVGNTTAGIQAGELLSPPTA